MAPKTRRWWRSTVPALVLAAALGACSAVETVSADRFRATGEVIALSGGDAGAVNACLTCHGLDGLGNGAGAPRLAGLEFGYLNRQMESYAAGLRQHPQMQYIAGKLSAADRQAVSAYYAAMQFQPGAMPQGPAPALWVSGDPARGLQPCAMCHGLRGEGIGPANPALGAQPAAYHVEQLEKWRRSERRNDPMNVMQVISRRLTPAELSALAAYAGALPGGPPSPGSPESFPEVRRADPRNGVSAPRPHEAAQ